MLISCAATLRHSLLLEDGVTGAALGLDGVLSTDGGVARAALGLSGVFSADGGDVGLPIKASVLEKDQPNGQREENRHARDNQRPEAQMSVNSTADQQQPNGKRDDKTNDNAQHPRGKIGAQHVHCRRMSTTAQ